MCSQRGQVTGGQEIQELRRRLEEEQRLREHAETQLKLQTQETTLPEFLDACHVHLSLGLSIQEDKSSSTKGDPANADRKLRPAKIREWTYFPNEQVSIWEELMSTEGRERMVSWELDLGYFQRQTVESRVASVVKQLHANPQLRETFCLNGDVAFENHANTLTDESNIVANMSSLSLSQRQPRRSDRLAAKSGSAGLSAQLPGRSQKTTQPRNSRPRADQFCVCNKGPEGKVPAFIIEYKAPHKFSLAHIKAGLQDMDLDEVLRLKKEKSPEDICRRVVAAVITHTFSYMIQGGLEFGYACTGEAFIFLRVPHHEPSTVYYYLSVPGEDVGQTTGWTGDLDDNNRLHLSALGQVLVFTLRALRVPTRDIAWTNLAVSKLKTWEMKDIPSSDFKPSPRSRKGYCRVSPVKTRSKSAVAASCGSSQDHRSFGYDDDAGGGFDPTTPSRRPREPQLPHPSASSLSASRRYCTQQCLLGLVKRGELDRKCPNMSYHGIDRHRLNRATLIRRLDRQLSSDNLQLDSQLGCESLHVHGTRGALFKITLWSHGYTFMGKGTPVEFVEGSKHEELVYSHLSPIQGVSVPVLLGSLRLRCPFFHDAENSLQAIHNLGMLHRDPIPGNMIWDEENSRVMFIDFERAMLQTRRIPLGGISSNQNRTRGFGSWEKSPNQRLNFFEREKRCMRNAL
ncbi:hypothetical protein BDV39DRAFT_218158 [Aspergillus sergii]|uniref:Uncharacterized protein n=1 Tax=Aspergillus sergii TaxID=1034303 RepID=A0A5N6WPZ8_9EURO|nr:hypothetical protein BDV39DRAFT_218158 [Aspergillus sergii]